MYKVAVLGDKNSVYGFSALGLDIFYAHNRAEALEAFKKVTSGNHAVVYVTEYVAELISEEIEKYNYLPSPAFILIPGVKGNTGKGMDAVKKSVEKAVGSDIISDV